MHRPRTGREANIWLMLSGPDSSGFEGRKGRGAGRRAGKSLLNTFEISNHGQAGSEDFASRCRVLSQDEETRRGWTHEGIVIIWVFLPAHPLIPRT